VSVPPGPDHDALVRELLDELGGLEREAIDGWSALDPGEQGRLERLDVELLGMLPQALEPVLPSAASRAALLEAARRQAGRAVGALPRTTAPVPGSRWTLALAAGLAAAALGVAGLLSVRLRDQSAALAQLEAEVGLLRQQTAALAASERSARDQLALVGAPGTAVCSLRQREASPLGGEPSGVLYVAADHQHWYIALHGLRPCPQGRVYQLWFQSEGGWHSAGTFRVEADRAIELSSPTMPEGTRAVRVTLEAPGGAAFPAGPEILFGEQPMTVL
jgi:hypothetical protein